MTLDADPDGMTLPFGVEDKGVGIVATSPDEGLPLEDIDGTVVATWYLGEWDAKLDPSWSFTVEGTYGLKKGTTLEILVADYELAVWVSGGTATVGASSITSDVGSGVPGLTTLVLVDPN